MKTNAPFRPWFISFVSLVIIACTSHAAEAQTVYVTKTGKKYHRETCQYLRYSKFPISIADAKARGYDACLVCAPTEKTNETRESSDDVKSKVKPVQKDTSIARPLPADEKHAMQQCAGTTKAGKQCKRMTASTNGYCWQHQP